MSTIHIHPTVSCDPAAIFKLQRSTGLLAVIRGSNARLVSSADQRAQQHSFNRGQRAAAHIRTILTGSNDRTPPTGPEAA